MLDGLVPTIDQGQCHECDRLWRTDRKLTYQCDVSKLTPALCFKFVTLSPDEDARQFLRRAHEIGFFSYRNLARVFLSPALEFFGMSSRTDRHAYLQIGEMFVLGSTQVATLLQRVQFRSSSDDAITVLDIGAGDGSVTDNFVRGLRSHLRDGTCDVRVTATEASYQMVQRLAQRGYDARHCTDLSEIHSTFDIVLLFNILDRCSSPIDVLHDVRQRCHDNTMIVLACVFPFRPYVVDGNVKQRLPTVEAARGFEASVVAMSEFLNDDGWEIQVIARVPYISECCATHPYQVLHDAIFVLKPRPQL
ncbi:MAG: hypothetical protein MHM6MM_004165 [Cercozoa sp. M6MM]